MSANKISVKVVKISGQTVRVESERSMRHPIYGKTSKIHKRYLADLNSMDLNPGDIVEISEVAPISKRKAWKVTRVIKKV